MSDFAGMEDMLQDFLTEASDLLANVDNQLVELEKRPDDKALLNEIFRGFHTIKGGAGFLNATELVKLCHRTENLFDKLRNAEMTLNPYIMDAIMAATGVVRDMFDDLGRAVQPSPANPALLSLLDSVLAGQVSAPTPVVQAAAPAPVASAPQGAALSNAGLDWDALYHSLLGGEAKPALAVPAAVVAVAPAPPPAPSGPWLSARRSSARSRKTPALSKA